MQSTNVVTILHSLVLADRFLRLPKGCVAHHQH